MTEDLSEVYDNYKVLYLLKPIKEVEPGWWKLKWRPIYKHTWSFYQTKYFSSTFGLGVRIWDSSAHNGWGRSYEHKHLEIIFIKWTFNFWIRWNFIVMAEGPSDMKPMRAIIN